jgi:hypothetical protein
VYPVHPAPRTAILVPWFYCGLRTQRSLRVFPHGWSRDAAAFMPGSIAGTYEQLSALAGSGTPFLTHSVIILWRPGQPRLTEACRDSLWAAFHVPVFEQVVGKSGELLAAECEAHDGLHLVAPFSHGEDESLDDSLCPCGRKTPRIGVAQGAALERRVASYAR